MSPLPIDVGQAALRWQLSGDNEPMITTWHYTTDFASGSATDHAETIATAWLAEFPSTQLFDAYTFLGVRVFEGTGAGPDVPGAWDLALAGSNAVSELPQNVALLLHKRTASPGRSGQGRNYLPPCYVAAETDVTPSGVITSANVTGMNAALATVLGDLVTAALPMVVLGADLVARQVTNWTMDPVIATRRRRLRR